MKKNIEDLIDSRSFYVELFGENQQVINSKKRMLHKAWDLFKQNFLHLVHRERVFIVSVPNRVEILGKHTDYQGGETIVLTGPKNFFAICALSKDDSSELMNADPLLGTTVLKFHTGTPLLITEGVGSQYSCTVVKRLMNNLAGRGLPPLKNVKAVFIGDIPFGGGTSGSSSKVISDFLIFTAPNDIFFDQRFVSLMIDNGIKAGMQVNQEGVDPYFLPLSMYLAHYENGLDFGDLKGDKGVGTFGGSEDHTAILLGMKDTLLLCRFCPTLVLERLRIPQDYMIVVAYSGRRAEKTKDAMEKYNRLSRNASDAVAVLNNINQTRFPYLRDFFKDLSMEQRADKAYYQLKESKKALSLAERAYQFFKEREIIHSALTSIKEGDINKFGSLINNSHSISRQYLKNIVPEIDFLQHASLDLGALGASGFGGGFGGCCYALIPREEISSFLIKWREEYLKKYPQYEGVAQFDVYPLCRGCFLEEVIG